MKITYSLKTDIVYDDEQNEFTVYGITARNSKGKILAEISDIFFDKAKAEKFVDKCKREKVSVLDLQTKAEEQLI